MTTTITRFPALSGLWSSQALDVVPRLTLVLVVTSAVVTWSLAVALALAIPAAVAMLNPAIYRNAIAWLAIGTGLFLHHAIEWRIVEDHHFLLAYWCLAIGLAFLTTDARRSFALSARLLLGLTFLFALVWKLTAGDFLSSDLFRFLLLTDPRFEATAIWGAGLPPGDAGQNAASYAALQAWDGTTITADLVAPTRLGVVAWAMTSWGVLIEALLAAAYLAPSSGKFIRRLRHVAVLAFCATTYLIVPVTLFGMTILTLALAATPARSRARPVYIAGFFALPVYTLVWHAITGLA